MIRIYLHQLPHMARMEMWIIDEQPNGKRYLAKPIDLVFEDMEPARICEPTMKFDNIRGSEFLQGLANSLAEVGYKVDLSSEKGELKATKYHLEDLRKLIFEGRRTNEQG